MLTVELVWVVSKSIDIIMSELFSAQNVIFDLQQTKPMVKDGWQRIMEMAMLLRRACH